MKNFLVNGNAICIEQFNLPVHNEINTKLHQQIQEIQHILNNDKNRSLHHDAFIDNINTQINKNNLSSLKHRLSEHIDNKIFISDKKTSEHEISFLTKITCDINEITSSEDKFTAFIESAGKHLLNRENKIRSRRIRTVPEPDGSYTEFISADKINNILTALRHFIVKYHSTDPLYCAIVSAVTILTIHPLSDGNGRLSRLVFNLILKREIENYIPLSELCHAARSGYILSLREAMLFSEWDSIIHYYCNGLSLILHGE